MATQSFLTNNGIALINKAYWEGTALTLILLKDTYAPNKDHDFLDDIEAHEADATSYARQAMANEQATINNSLDSVDYTADDVAFGNIGGAVNNTIHYAAVVEIKGGASSADPVLLILRMEDTTTPDDYTARFSNPIFRSTMG